MRMSIAKKHLARIWLIGGGILFMIFILQTALGRYHGHTKEVWGWLVPAIVPTASLVVGVLVSDRFGVGSKPQLVMPFVFRLAAWLSFVYLLLVLLTILLGPFSPFGPVALMKQSGLWLGPLQGLVTAAVGAFFVNRPKDV